MSGALEWTLGQLPRKGNNWTNLSLKERKKRKEKGKCDWSLGVGQSQLQAGWFVLPGMSARNIKTEHEDLFNCWGTGLTVCFLLRVLGIRVCFTVCAEQIV